MKPLTNQRQQTPAASQAQFLHRASLPHAEIGEKICNLRVIFFSGARNYFQRRRRAAPNQLASDRKISTELDPSDFPVLHFSVFARRLTKNAGLMLSE
jgi:hypothetical protein